MQQLTHTTTEHPSTHIHGNQQSIYDINIQRQELDKSMLIANTLKGKLNIQHMKKASWIVTTIKAILKMPIQKFENPISCSGEHTRQRLGIEKYSRHSKVT